MSRWAGMAYRPYIASSRLPGSTSTRPPQNKPNRTAAMSAAGRYDAARETEISGESAICGDELPNHEDPDRRIQHGKTFAPLEHAGKQDRFPGKLPARLRREEERLVG